MAAKKPVQTALDGTVCDHRRVEPVLSFGGDTLAWRCVGCTKITAHHGKCSGCGEVNRKLACLVPSRKMSFCTTECYKRLMARRRKADAAEAKALMVKGAR